MHAQTVNTGSYLQIPGNKASSILTLQNECTKAAILTFWKIVLEILHVDTVSKQCVFCWISDFTELKALDCFFYFCGIFEAIELGRIRFFINLLVHKNGNSKDAMHVVRFQNFQFWQNQQIQRCHVMKFKLWFCRMVLQIRHVIRFQFCWFSNSLFLFCWFCKVTNLYCDVTSDIITVTAPPSTCLECNPVLS